MNQDYVFTSESVTAGHPDKLCDRISDALVDRYLRQDRFSRVAAECAVSTGIVFVAVKFSSEGSVDIPFAVREVIGEVGYHSQRSEFTADRSTVMTNVSSFVHPHSRIDETTLTEDELERVVSLDQTTVFGYACRHTPALMPLPLWLSHKLARRLEEVSREPDFSYLSPDGKVQVGVEFRGRLPSRIHSLTLVASQWEPDAPAIGRLRGDLREAVVGPAFVDEEFAPDSRTAVNINPEGAQSGGPLEHSGLTGRKTADDTYGGYARHCGSALSGKDPSRIDRIGAYAARCAAKSVVAAGLAEDCEVQLSYSVGLARPVSVQVETFGTGRLAEADIVRRLRGEFDFRPAAIIGWFNLRDVPNRSPDGFYRRLAAYGHFGRPELDLPWEGVECAAALK